MLYQHLEKIRVFKVISDVGSFTLASQTLRLSQSTLSYSIQTLEEVLNISLFKRSRCGITLTESGKVLYEFSKRLELDVESVVEKITHPELLLSGRLRIATHETLAVHIWPKFISSFGDEHPQVKIFLTSGRIDSIVKGVLNRDLHLALTVSPHFHEDLEVVPIYSGHFKFFASAHTKTAKILALKQNALTLKELNQVPVFTDTGAHLKQGTSLAHYFNENGIRSHLQYEVTSFEASIRLAQQGLGIAALPDRNAREALKNKTLREVTIRGLRDKKFGPYSICAFGLKHDMETPLLKLLVAKLRAHFDHSLPTQ